MASHESQPDTPIDVQDVKAMFGRISAIAELLAKVDYQRPVTEQSRQTPQKHNIDISVYSVSNKQTE